MPRKRKAPLTLKEQQKRKKDENAERRSDPEKYEEELARRRERREDPEYSAQELSRDNSSRRERRSDPEYSSQELLRDDLARRERRLNPEYLIAETSRDESTRRRRYENDPDYEEEVVARKTSSRRERRSDPEYSSQELSRDNATRRIRRKKRDTWDKGFVTFNQNVKDGPYHRCYSCDKLLFRTQLATTTYRDELLQNPKITGEYLNALILPELIDDASYTFCTTCMGYIRKAAFPRFNINHSNLRFPDVPDVVKNLSPLAERMVAARIPFMKIEQISYDRQLKIKSGVVNVPIDVRRTVQSIPQPPEESGVVEISLMRKMEYRNAYMKEIVRPSEIWEAARLLCDTPLYKQENITLNANMEPNVMEQNDADMEALRLAETVRQEPEPSTSNQNLSDLHLPEETLLDTNDAFRFAPGEGETPIPMFMDPYCEELAFPTIWFGHPRGKPPAGVRLSFTDHVNSELRRYDRRACRPDHVLFLYKKGQIEQMTKQVNVAIRKSANTMNITAGQVLNKQFLENAIRNDSAYKFLSSIVGTPPYFEAKKKNVMATVRQTGGFTFFITNSAAETKWPELLVILKKTVDKLDVTEEAAIQMTFEEKARLISTDPITCAQYFHYRMNELWKLIQTSNGPFGDRAIIHKINRIEFQHRGSPHAHQMVTIQDAPKFDADDPESYDRVIQFIDEIITTDSDDPDIADLIYIQRHKCSHTCRRGKKNKEYCRFNAPFLPLERTMILEPIDSDGLSDEKKKQLDQLSKKLHDVLEADAANIHSFDELLEILDCNVADYILAARLKLKSRKIFMKRKPKDCRINNYNKQILMAMRSNMDIQFILDVYSCISYVVDYVNKSDKGLSRLLRQCIEDHKRGNTNIKKQMSALSKIIYNSSETPVQEAAWIRLRLPMCSTTDLVEFINSGPKSTRQCMLKSNAELEKLARTDPNSVDIYKKSPIDRYADRPDVLENICLADFIAKYTYHSKKGGRKTNDDEDEQFDTEELEVLNDDENEETTSEKKEYKLKNNSGYITLRRRPKILRFVRFNRHEDEINYFREMCLLFYPWRNEDDEIEGQDCKLKFLANEDLIKENFDKYNAVELDLDEIYRDIEEDRIAQENEEQNAEVVDPNFENVFDFDDNIVPNAAVEMGLEVPGTDISVTKYQVPNLMRDDEYFELCDSLNELQKDLLMHVINKFKPPSNLPIYYFLSGGAGVGKSRLINALFQSVVRIFRSEPGPVDSNEVLLVAYTGMAAHNIGGITAHSAFSLAANQGKTDVGLSPDMANTMACQLQRLKLIIIDEISMLSAEHLNQISSNLKQIFRSSQEFAGRSVIVVGDFNQLRPVGGSYAFQSKNAHHRESLTAIVDNPQWQLFQLFELTQIMRQRDDLRFAEALSRLALGQTTPEDNAMFATRSFADENSLPIEARTILRLMAHNKDVDEFNELRARQLINGGARHYTFKAIDKFVGNYTTTQKNRARHLLETLIPKDTQGLHSELKLVIGLRYMVCTNIDVSDGIFNGASGFLRFVEIQNRSITAVYMEFDDEKTGAKARSSRLGLMKANNMPTRWTPIKTTKKSFYVCQGGKVQVSREQFPLVMAEAITVHKSQGRSEPRIVVDVRHFDRKKYYVAFSRVTSLSGLHILGKFVPPKPVEPNDVAYVEMARLRRNPLVPKYQSLRNVPDNIIQIISHNVQSIRKHITTVIADRVFINSHIISLQESWAIDNESYNIPDFEEISRNQFLGRPKAFGTINFCKIDFETRISDRIETEHGDTKDHVELSAFRIDKKLTIINIYNNPSSNIDTLKLSLMEIKEFIDESEDVLIFGDFNHNLTQGNQLESFMNSLFDMVLLSPREPTTNAGTTIDGVFGRIKNYNVETFIYESYASQHKPIVIRVQGI
ncbi:hypothetical protein PVAND_004740 [Polypedilum vanderplanki]|uniref:ATP-dependent DNA helicase n=1 Tax=Polypedilum vanderplanki TaxID=319348 RepID=A0A9J6BYN5_POLVA|nr:hypothetical protein PVAND_004740 [Polypedilum vanderplanki]